MEYLYVLLKIMFFYFFIVVTYRIMGKREIGKLGIMDLIVSIMIAELAAMCIEEADRSMLYTIIPISFLVIVQLLMAQISLKFPKLRDLFDGKPSIIIDKGKLNFKEMAKQRYNIEDLLLQLRIKNIKSIEEVEYAVLENNGELSAFKYPNNKTKGDFPLPIIVDGEIQKMTLDSLNKNEYWITNMLHKKCVNLDNVFYAFYKEKKIYIIKKSEIDGKIS